MHPQDRLFCEIAVQLELLTRDQVAECMQTLQRDPKGRNIGAIASMMGFLSQAEAELVLAHQQRVLERRREQRAASQGQRETESRAAAASRAARQARPAPTAKREAPPEARRVRPREPTPTTQWTHASAEPGLAPAASRPAKPALSPEQLAAAEVRETLEARPPRAARAASQPVANSAWQNTPSSAAVTNAPPAMRKPLPTQLEARPGPVPASHVQKDRGPGGTQLGAPRPEPPPRPAPRTSAPPALPSAAGSSPNRAAIGGGTLLSGAALAQRQRDASQPIASAAKRPVPQGRDWRNPSRPPPPTAALDAEPMLSRVAHADTLALPANDASTARPTLPSPDEPGYLAAALALAADSGASDLEVHSGAALCARVDGKLRPLSGDVPLSREAAERVVAELLDEAQWTQLMLEGDLRFAYELSDGRRFRAHAYCQERGTDIVFRVLPQQILSPDKLGIAAALRHFPAQAAGLFVFSGPPGSGKTTSLAALTQALVAERARHVVTVESPIELVHATGLGLIEQREVGQHAMSFAEGIDLAQRQGADVIVVSDLSAPATLEACLRAVRARCCVLGGLRASSSVQALSKLLRATNPQQAERLRSELAYALKLVLHQRLVPRAKSAGRVAALECVLNSVQVAQLIREDKLQQLPAVLATGKASGMLALDDALEELVRNGTVTAESARRAAHRRERFKAS